MGPLHYFNLDGPSASVFRDRYRDLPEGGKFFMDAMNRIGQNRFIPRDGEWSTPWRTTVAAGFEMPAYDPHFALSFADVTNQKALDIKQRIIAGERFALMYSGGIDSTTILAALLTNLTMAERQSLCIVANKNSLAEYRHMWREHISGKLMLKDSDAVHYDDLIEQGFTPITGDEGDCIFGTDIGIRFYRQHPDLALDAPYANCKDALIRYFALDDTPHGRRFGELFYLKMERCIQTARMPIHSLHDFFWWMIFNPKYLNCGLRGATYFQDRFGIRECLDKMVNWYNDPRYQQWSMANNNNGQKIQQSIQSYKTAARQYILDFTGDLDYFQNKQKVPSLCRVLRNPRYALTVAVAEDYRRLTATDPETHAFILDGLMNHKVDWV